jgi:uncharacterized protein YecT (DUF1311 family)
MRALRLAALALLLAAATPAVAQSGFTAADATALETCLAAAPETPADCIGAAAYACQGAGPEFQSTLGIVECLSRETAWWDARLNADYQTIRAAIDAESFAALRDAQRAWMGWRDAKCKFDYVYWREGTIRSVMYASCQLETTARRAQELADLVD